ncbi:tetratricopeptide repeat protein [Actinoplanes sp. URMC 104]|uniref:tetratricopeptide repeat protein n=1 Tax=Actinoplanes sp. URMC 104 TaxID=3423409 RepID=UPI003F1BA1D0
MSQPSPLAPARQRAHALASAGDLAAARALLEQAVELGKVNLSEDDPDVLRTAYELGTVLQQADDPSAARRVLEEAYAAGQWRLGDADPLMVLISHDIGVVAEELGNRHEARKAFGRVAELGAAALGGEHPAVARARAYLGAPVRGEEDAPTTVISAVPAEPRGQTVQPPSAGNQHVWTGPPADATPGRRVPAPRSSPIDEPTVAQPVVEPRGYQAPPQVGSVPTQRSAPGYPSAPTSGPAPGRPGTPSSGATPGYPSAPTSGQTPSYPSAPTSGQTPGYPGTPASGAAYPEAPSSGPSYSSAPPYPNPPSSGPAYGNMPGLPQPGPAAAMGGVTAYGQGSATTTGRKGLGVFAAIAAVLAAVIAVAALVFVLANRTSDPGNGPDVPTLAGPPPSDVKLTDNGTAVRIAWQDPTDGTVSFMVIMGHPEQELKPVGTLVPGRTSFEMSGLNRTLNYCFAVVAVYSGNQFATSPQACTSRASATPR